jgi:hypothetical protein
VLGLGVGIAEDRDPVDAGRFLDAVLTVAHAHRVDAYVIRVFRPVPAFGAGDQDLAEQRVRPAEMRERDAGYAQRDLGADDADRQAGSDQDEVLQAPRHQRVRAAWESTVAG